LSIRFKVILPYLLLTLVVAITGVYVVTRLVASSLNERLTNQLLESGRVVSDSLARQDLSHLEALGVVAYTSGLAEALAVDNQAGIYLLAYPAAASQGLENLIIIDAAGREQLHLLRQADGSYQKLGEMGAGASGIIQRLLTDKNPQNLPSRGVGKNPADGRYYYYTAAPVILDGQVAGVVMVGTSLESLLPYLKSTALADVILYFERGQAIATTLGAQNKDPEFVASLSVPSEVYQQVLASTENVSGENIEVDGRAYRLARGALRVSGENLGAFAVILPLNFVLQAGADSRTTYVILFTAAMLGVILLGYFISRLIINPLYALVRASEAVAQGDLSHRSGIASKDEIGLLANTFDGMTANLQARTAELERTYQILEQMDRTKVSFIEVSAHELRTPLTLVKGYAQMLQMRPGLDPETGTLVKGIMDGSSRMMGIVNNMLDVSKIDSQTLKMLPETMDAASLLLRVQQFFEADLQERSLTLELRNLDDLASFSADPDLLYKAFYHLVMNAIKYTPDGGAISLSGRVVQEKGGDEIELVVRDTGIGIDPQYHELIFEKFFQTGEVRLHSSGKTKFKGGGPGLGLAIAKGIIGVHRGRIWVESAGHDETTYPGSAFYVRLPLQGAN
jgi:signal transduction histidine kinase